MNRWCDGANQFDAVITDQKMADGQGLDVLVTVREQDPALSVVFPTAFATVELAVESMRQGALDFVTKPFQPEGGPGNRSPGPTGADRFREVR